MEKTKISKDIRYIGVNDHEIDLFEGQYIVPNGMSYNSYVIVDEKTAVMDTFKRLSEKGLRIIWLFTIWSRTIQQT